VTELNADAFVSSAIARWAFPIRASSPQSWPLNPLAIDHDAAGAADIRDASIADPTIRNLVLSMFLVGFVVASS